MIQTIDPIIFRFRNGEVQVALYRRPETMARFPNALSLPGGMVFEDKDDSLNHTIERILKNKVHFTPVFMESMAPVGNRYRDPDGWSTTIPYLCLTAHNEEHPDIAWVEVSKLVSSKDGADSVHLPFDHNELITQAYSQLVNRTGYSTLPVYMMPDKFTLPDLQACCEAILGSSLHKAPFRRRWLNTELLVETNEQGRMTTTNEDGKRARSARLFTLSEKHNLVFFERTMSGSKQNG